MSRVYQYKKLIENSYQKLTVDFEQMGSDGWELVSSYQCDNKGKGGESICHVFKKEFDSKELELTRLIEENSNFKIETEYLKKILTECRNALLRLNFYLCEEDDNRLTLFSVDGIRIQPYEATLTFVDEKLNLVGTVRNSRYSVHEGSTVSFKGIDYIVISSFQDIPTKIYKYIVKPAEVKDEEDDYHKVLDR